MKLISNFFTNRARLVAAFIMLTTFVTATTASATGKRVFWNKFDITTNDKNEVVLTWNVTEYNNKNFRVQHSTDGIKWENIGLVQSQNSAESMTDYTFIHKNKLTGKQYYRLQDTDVDMTSTSFSPVKTLILSDEKKAINLWPNPATNEISLAGHDGTGNTYSKAQVFDLSGRMLIEKQFGENSNTINIKELLAGTYILRMQSENGKINTEKFVKQ